MTIKEYFILENKSLMVYISYNFDAIDSMLINIFLIDTIKFSESLKGLTTYLILILN